MAPAESKRLVGRNVTAVACFDSFGKLAMTMLAACRRRRDPLLLAEQPGSLRRQRLEVRRIGPKTRIEKHNWNDLRQLCGAMAGDIDALIWVWMASAAAMPCCNCKTSGRINSNVHG